MKPFLDELKKNDLTTHNYININTPRFIFLCGKGINAGDCYDKTNRGRIQKYIQNQIPLVKFAISEYVWKNLYETDIDLLTFEVFLAEVSDYIILFVESMGSACELGAFTFDNRDFMKKLIIILDEKYRADNSFIKIGPVMKAKKNGAAVIYADLTGAILSSLELRNKVNEIIDEMNRRKRIIINRQKEKVKIYPFILEILELIKLFQPIELKGLPTVYKTIKDFNQFKFSKMSDEEFDIKVKYIFAFLKAVKLIEEKDGNIHLAKTVELENFMFKYSSLEFNKMRNQILAKKYKYRDI